MTTPTQRQLDIFAQMVASGSIADCAHDLGVPRSVVERDLRTLEERLGHRLFETRGNAEQLTEAGRKTVEAMRRLSETTPESWAQKDEPPASAPAAPPPLPAATPSAMPRRQITLSAHPAIFGHFQDALTAFEQANGDVGIALELDAHTAAQAAPLLASGRIDIAYFYTLGEPAGLASRYVWSEPLALYVGVRHPLAARDSVDADDLAGIDLIALSPGNGLRILTDDALAAAGLDRRAPGLETDNLFDIMVAVRQGAGYFAAFGPLARDFGRMEGIKRLPFARALPQIDVRQAVSAAMRDDPVVGSLAEYLFR